MYFLRTMRETLGLMTHRAFHRRSSLVSRTTLYVGLILLVLVSVNFSTSLHTESQGNVSGRSTSNVFVSSASVSPEYQSVSGKNVVIGIYDSGVNLENPALISQGRSRIIAQACFGGSTEVNPCNTDPGRAAQNSCSSTDIGCFHGMAVAGLAAGNDGTARLNGEQVDVGGVAPGAEISYVRNAMTRDGTIEYNDYVNALNKFVNDVKSGSQAAPDVLNLSLGFPRSSYRDCEQDNSSKRAIDFLVNSGVVVVAASGNDSNKNEVTYPACMKNVIAVGSVSGDRVSSFSNMSSDIDLVASGDNQWAHLSDSSRYVKVTGTSFAAPLVSGAVALIKEVSPSMSPAAIQELLVSSADNVIDPATGSSFKKMNINNALAKISKNATTVKAATQPSATQAAPAAQVPALRSAGTALRA